MAPDRFLSLLTSFLRAQEEPHRTPRLSERSHRADSGVQQHAPHRAALAQVAAPERRCVGRTDFGLTHEFCLECSRCVARASQWRSADSSRQGLIERRYGKVSLRDGRGTEESRLRVLPHDRREIARAYDGLIFSTFSRCLRRTYAMPLSVVASASSILSFARDSSDARSLFLLQQSDLER